jgi:hypothetical protein
MKQLIYIGLVLLVSCQAPTNKQENTSNQVDAQKEQEQKEIDPFANQPTYEDLKAEYILKYKNIEIIDTNFLVGNLEYRLQFEHYCLYDTLVIPEKYSWSNNPQDFITHNFESKVLLAQGKDTIVSTIIRKDAFEQNLDNSLLKYGVLLYPSYRGFNQAQNAVQIHYSISVPLTDVGKGVELEIGLDGNLTVKE